MFLKNLTRLMEQHELNRKELAIKIGIAPSTVNSWYNRSYENVSLKTLRKLSAFFNVTIEELVNCNKDITICFSNKEYTEKELIAISNFAKLIKEHRKDESN